MASGLALASIAQALVVAAIVSYSLLASHAGSKLIANTCERTKDAALCVAVLTADPWSGRASSVHGLADVALNIAADTAAESYRVVRSLDLGRPGTPEWHAARVCRDAYDDAEEKLSFHARTSFEWGDYDGASQSVARSQGAGDRCEDAFKEVNTEYAITDMNRQMTERCVVARGLIDLLASSSSCCWCCSCSNKISYFLCSLFF